MTMHNRLFRIPGAAPLVLLMLLTAAPTGGEELDSIVAVVNDDVIVRSELEARTSELLRQLGGTAQPLPPREAIEKQVLENLITIRLQLQTAQRAGITVDDETVARAIQNIAKTNKVTLVEMRQIMERDGVDFGQFREQMRNEIIMSRLRNQEVVNRVVVSDAEIDNFLQKEQANLARRSAYRLSHILIATPEGATPEQLQRARQKADEVVAQLRAGSDFTRIALTHSAGRQALEGGDLGWRKTGELPGLFADVVATMNRGDISDPIQSPGGYHIVKLVDYKGGDRQIVHQTHARHILVIPSEITSDRDAETRLKQLKQRIDNGDDFITLARSHSEDKASALKGGDLGWVNGGDMAPKFEEEMGQLTIGQTSEPFRTEYGWHIVQVIERRDYDNTKEAMRNQAREELRMRKANEAYELWARRLRDEAYVEIHLNKP
jgi:peptidyl-prolyl cis-trans isomerase SurA